MVWTVSGCKQITEDFVAQDGQITIGASTSYVNEPATRTEYSGEDENGGIISSASQYERIDWVENKDLVRIVCPQAQDMYHDPIVTADYRIGTSSGSGRESAAGATPVSEEETLYWGEGDHYFYALYPAAGTTSNYHQGAVTESESDIEYLSGNKARITGSIPATQNVVRSGNVYKPNMNLAYMYAAEKSAITTGNITLHFYPLVTAFEFSLRALDDVMAGADLLSLKVSSGSTDLTGGFTATLDYDAADKAVITKASTGLGREVTVTFPEHTRLSKTAYSVVTVLTNCIITFQIDN